MRTPDLFPSQEGRTIHGATIKVLSCVGRSDVMSLCLLTFVDDQSLLDGFRVRRVIEKPFKVSEELKYFRELLTGS